MIMVLEAISGLVMVMIFCTIQGPKSMLHLGVSNAIEDTDTMSTKLKILAKNPAYLLIVAAFSSYTFTVAGVSYYTVDYFQDVFDLSTTLAGMIFGGVTVITGFIGSALGGIVLDRVKQKNISEAKDLRPL